MNSAPGDFINDLRYPQILNSFNLVALTILLFDHLLTFGDEVKYVWKHKITLFSVLFLANRYYALVTMVCYVVGAIVPYDIQEHIYPRIETPNRRVTKVVFDASQPGWLITIQAMPTISVAEAIMILRVYSIYQRNNLILACLAFFWIAQIILASYLLATHVFLPLDVMRMSYAFNTVLGLTFFLPPVLFDSMVAGFLIFGFYQRSKPLRSKTSLVNLVIRDGLFYFFVVFGSNVAWTAIGFILRYKFKSISLGFAPMYIMSSSITTTMIGRLTLNLRRYAASSGDEVVFRSMGCESMSLEFQSVPSASAPVGEGGICNFDNEYALNSHYLPPRTIQ